MTQYPSLFAQISTASRGKNWLPRLPILLFFAYIFAQYLKNPDYQSIFWGLNLGIHELGHVVFGLFGQFMGIAGGSLLQCLVPVISVGMFIHQEDYFALCFSFCWLSVNLYEVARYVADARAMLIPLVSPFGGHVIHDWNYLLTETGLIAFEVQLANALRGAAIFSMLLGLIFGGWVLTQMKVKEKSHA